MKRVGNAQTIADIEFVIGAPTLSDPRRSWTAHGVECTRDRHRYSGPAYEFNIEVVDLRKSKAGRAPSWRVLIVTEWWQARRMQSRNSQYEMAESARRQGFRRQGLDEDVPFGQIG